MPTGDTADRARRVELILRELGTLPTPSPIALRLLSAASDDQAEVAEIVSLIQTDPGMTARLLGMCRRAATGLGQSVTTVDRAVVMLGLDAVRAMLLSVDIREFMTGGAAEAEPAPGEDAPSGINRAGLWRHSLAVAVAAERLASINRSDGPDLNPDEAFVCGLLHDIGKIALDLLLPRAYARAVQLAERTCEPLAAIERRLIGVDHATAGKRLAERWGLPEVIRDVVWLHGRPARSIPDLPHKRMVGVVTAADGLARLMHVGASGNAEPAPPIGRLAEGWGLPADRLEQVAASLHQAVADRAERLGMEEAPATELLVQSLAAANRTLVTLNESQRRRTSRHAQLNATHDALREFFAAVKPTADPLDALCAIAACGRAVFGPARVVVAARVEGDPAWTALAIDDTGRRRRTVTKRVAGAADPAEVGAALAAEAGLDADEIASLTATTLVDAEAGAATLVHPWRFDRERGVALSAWRMAASAAIERSRTDRLNEALSILNADLAEARERAADAESYARLGELTAGAAHEMNNPLAVISGRAQHLRQSLRDEEHLTAVGSIVRACDRLSALIAGLHFVATPPPVRRAPTDLTEVVSRTIRALREQLTEAGSTPAPMKVTLAGALPPVHIDGGLFSVALEELIRNALEAPDSERVEVRIQTDDDFDRLMITVLDDGAGISPEALAHATDPFFSRRDAGRGIGLGLAKARRVVEAHGGTLTVRPRPDRGTEARITLTAWRPEHMDEHSPPIAA
ncbi:MAG: HDOD domain-containing protein [Planctomycetota bacterium]|nr:MAG: HDOD domain-containing protein [Planctomycetota bacterium]